MHLQTCTTMTQEVTAWRKNKNADSLELTRYLRHFPVLTLQDTTKSSFRDLSEARSG